MMSKYSKADWPIIKLLTLLPSTNRRSCYDSFQSYSFLVAVVLCYATLGVHRFIFIEKWGKGSRHSLFSVCFKHLLFTECHLFSINGMWYHLSFLFVSPIKNTLTIIVYVYVILFSSYDGRKIMANISLCLILSSFCELCTFN